MFQPFHADTDATVHDEYLIGSRSAEEVLFQDDVTFTCVRGYSVNELAIVTRKFTCACLSGSFSFSQPDVACLSNRVILALP